MTTLYVAGPMRNRPRFNFPLFDEVAACLRRKGYDVINPADMDRARVPGMEQHPAFQDGDIKRWQDELGFNFHQVIGSDLVAIIQEADGIVLLPGWENSTGAGHEKYVAEATGKTVQYAYKTQQGHWLFLDFDLYARDRMHSVKKDLGVDLCGTPYTSLENQRHEFGRVEGDDIEILEYPVDILTKSEPDRERLVERMATTVIGLVGYAQVGKDTLAAQLVERHGFTRIAFADVLRECLYELNPVIDVDNCGEEIRLQEIVDRSGWERAKTGWPEIRQLLQRLGTEVGRNILGNDIWVDTALAKIKPGGKYVITDVRFPNEFAAIEKLGGTTIRIRREGYGPVNDHWSEKALDGYECNVTVDNDGSPDDMGTLVAAAVLFERSRRP